MKFRAQIIYIALLFAVVSCGEKTEPDIKNIRIAFMADVHLLNVYGKFQDSDYAGVRNPNNGQFAIIRTMAAQLHSTRIFNENYFAFLAALDDAVKRNVKYVILPGDFSDDGQPLNVRGLKRILDEYAEKHGISFFVITGNHDPVGPFAQKAGKRDFLGEGGKPQPIMSKTGMYSSNPDLEHPVVVTGDIKKMGYQEIISMLGDYGFFPKNEHLFWETPFSKYNYGSYNFDRALKAADLKNRYYAIPPNNFQVPDVSYLIEPVKGLWLLAIDANVYIPKEKITGDPKDPKNYSGASVGYNNVLTHKKHLVNWVKKVTEEAEKQGKTLIAFSHFPMVEFNDDASQDIGKLLGKGKMQLHRVPNEDVVRSFADAGIKIHFGGHMHINDTGIRKTDKGNTLVNIQTPSLAAYIPAYKLLTIKENDVMDVKTVVLDSVPRFNEFFGLYKQEYGYLQRIAAENIWNREILSSKNYHEYTNWHLKELVRLRFIPNDWPSDLSELLLQISGKELLVLSQVNGDFSLNQVINAKDTVEYSSLWNAATQKARKKARDNGLQFEEFGDWNGFNLIFDFYRLRNADQLALKDIGTQRADQYRLIIASFPQNQKNQSIGDLKELFNIFQKFLNGAPADHFQVNLKTGKIENINN